MAEWKPKRFWKTADIAPSEGGFAVVLDSRPVKTPAKSPLIVPTEALARAIAVEWDAQEEVVAPETMPVTRTANSAIDKVTVQHGEVADMLAAYGDSDLICYRATDPAPLVARQAELWDPVLDWARADLGVDLTPVSGVIHAPQPQKSLSEISRLTHQMSAFELAGFHDLVCLTGSFVLGMATARGHLTAEEAWPLSRVDEAWQEEQWGHDDEAAEAAEIKRQAFLAAARFYEMARQETV